MRYYLTNFIVNGYLKYSPLFAFIEANIISTNLKSVIIPIKEIPPKKPNINGKSQCIS